VPYGDEIKLMVQYQGKAELALKSGLVSAIHKGHVRENDEFEYDEGTNAFVRFRPCLRGERGELIAAFAWAKMPDGTVKVKVVDREMAMKARARSKGYAAALKKSPQSPNHAWFTDEASMWEKTAVHRLSALLPKAKKLEDAEARGHVVVEGGVKAEEEGTPLDTEGMVDAAATPQEAKKPQGTITVLRPDGSEVSAPAPDAWKMTPEIWTEIQELVKLAGLGLEALTAELNLPPQGRDYQKRHAETISSRIDDALNGVLRDLAKKVGLDEVSLAQLMADRGMPPSCKGVRPGQFKAFKAELESAIPPADQPEIGW
jgi:hypothetical protein